MKYYVMYVANGNLAINQITEWSDLSAAKSKYFKVCDLMYADASVTDAYVVLLDNMLNQVEDYKEAVHKGQTA